MSDDEEYFDLDALAAEQRSKRRPWKILHGGVKFEMVNAYAVDLEILEAAEEGDIKAIRDAVRIGLGDRYEEFRAIGMDLDDLTALFSRWLTVSGSQPGESAASTGSSESTERPSKPTSTASTASASPKRSTARKSAGTRRGNSSSG